MNVLLRLASRGLPGPFRRRKARRLFALTAACFGASWPPEGPARPGPELERFAVFTRRLVDGALAEGRDLAPVEQELRRRALDFGLSLRKTFRVRGRGDAVRLLGLAYRAIGIDLRADEAGGILVRECLFSRFYTPETCRVIASLDEGIMAGILGEGGLKFEGRITEGRDVCRAVFRFRESGA